MYQVLHDINSNNVTDSGRHCVCVSVEKSVPGLFAVTVGNVASNSELLVKHVVTANSIFRYKSATSKSGNGVGYS